MKKNFFLALGFCITIAGTSYAQVSSTPESPRNYKPQPKELAPMPGELTDEMIFPVLGKYDYVNKEGEVTSVTITRDAENKGVVWVSGMPQGKFKADLKQSPCTYKIPAQKTLQNEIVPLGEGETAAADPGEKPEPRYSGKSVKEGTLIFDSSSHKLYVNIGAKYNDENPATIFPEMLDENGELATADNVQGENGTEKELKSARKVKKNEALVRGTNYVLTKAVEMAVAPATMQ